MANHFIDAVPSFGQEFARAIGGGFSKGVSGQLAHQRNLEMQKQKNKLSGPSSEEILPILKNLGVPDEEAQLYAYLSKGGQTEFSKRMLDHIERGLEGKIAPGGPRAPENAGNDMSDQPPSEEDEYREPVLTTQNAFKELNEHIKNENTGLTPKDIYHRNEKRHKENSDELAKSNSSLRDFGKKDLRFKKMAQLNDSGKITKGIGKVLLDKDGNFVIPSALGNTSTETQLFVKLLNEAANSVKEMAGNKVTNFDIQQYMRQHPTLLNSEEGRRQILDYLSAMNKYESVYHKNLTNLYRKAGGARNADIDVARDLARRMSLSSEKKIQEAIMNIGKSDDLGDPREMKGKFRMEDENGYVFVSDGEKWVPSSLEEYEKSQRHQDVQERATEIPYGL